MEVESMSVAEYRTLNEKGRRKRRVKPKMSESRIQIDLIEWIDTIGHRVYPEMKLLFAIPNGGHRYIRVAQKMKAEGVRAGIPDLFLPVARGGFHGMFIEMKYGRNRQTKEQVEWFKELKKNGYYCIVCYSQEEAQEVLGDYLSNNIKLEKV